MADWVRDITLRKPRAQIFDKRDTKLEQERVQRAVYAEVDARDQKRCRCCGRIGNPYAIDPLGKIHRAHISDRSRGGALSARNLVSLCWICHYLEHGKQLHIVGTDANEERDRLIFDIEEVAVVEVFGVKPVPLHVHIVTRSRAT